MTGFTFLKWLLHNSLLYFIPHTKCNTQSYLQLYISVIQHTQRNSSVTECISTQSLQKDLHASMEILFNNKKSQFATFIPSMKAKPEF